MERIKLICLGKIVRSGKYGDKTVGYTVQEENGSISDMTAEQLKLAIWDGRVEVLNLKLTADMKLRQRKHKDVNVEIITRRLD